MGRGGIRCCSAAVSKVYGRSVALAGGSTAATVGPRTCAAGMTVEVEEMMMEVRFLSARRADMLPCCVWLIGGIPERVAGYEAFLKHLTSTSTLFVVF